MLLDQDEASRLVEATRGIVLGDAETQGAATPGNAGLYEVNEQALSNSLVPTGGAVGVALSGRQTAASPSIAARNLKSSIVAGRHRTFFT